MDNLQEDKNNETITNDKSSLGETTSSNSVSTDGKDQNPDKTDVVSHKTYARVMDEIKALKSEKASLTQKISEFENENKTREEKELRKRNNFEQLLKNREKELADKETELTQLRTHINESSKMGAFLDALPGNLSKEYWGLVNLEEIALNPETNKPDEASVEVYAKRFAEIYGRVLETGVNSKLPKNAPQTYTQTNYDDWRNLKSSKEMRDKMPANIFEKKG